MARQRIMYTFNYSDKPLSPEKRERIEGLLAKLCARAFLRDLEHACAWCPTCPHPAPECDESDWRKNVSIMQKALAAKQTAAHDVMRSNTC